MPLLMMVKPGQRRILGEVTEEMTPRSKQTRTRQDMSTATPPDPERAQNAILSITKPTAPKCKKRKRDMTTSTSTIIPPNSGCSSGPEPVRAIAKPLNPSAAAAVTVCGPIHSELQNLHGLLAQIWHRNRNQHRGQKWWKWLALLKRGIRRLADLTAPHQVEGKDDGARLKLLSGDRRSIDEGGAKSGGRRGRRRGVGGGREALEAEARIGEAEAARIKIEKQRERDRELVRAQEWVREVLLPGCWLAFSTLVADSQFSTLGIVLIATLSQFGKLIGLPQPPPREIQRPLLYTSEGKQAKTVHTTSLSVTGVDRGKVVESIFDVGAGNGDDSVDGVDVGEVVQRDDDDVHDETQVSAAARVDNGLPDRDSPNAPVDATECFAPPLPPLVENQTNIPAAEAVKLASNSSDNNGSPRTATTAAKLKKVQKFQQPVAATAAAAADTLPPPPPPPSASPLTTSIFPGDDETPDQASLIHPQQQQTKIKAITAKKQTRKKKPKKPDAIDDLFGGLL